MSDTISAEAFATRSASMKVAVQDGQTVVIGGLIEDQITETIKKVPLVGDIPIIGLLFRHSTTVISNTELLVFVSPHIYTEEDVIPEEAMEKFREIKEKPMPSLKKSNDEKKKLSLKK